MNRAILILVVLLHTVSWSQNRKFLAKLDSVEAPMYSVAACGSDQLDVVHFDAHYYSGLMIGALNHEREKKGRGPFEQDSLFNQIATCGIQTFSKSRFLFSDKWKLEYKSINYALLRKKSRYKLFVAYAFMIDLMDLPNMAAFYYDPKDRSDTPRLYKGKRSKARTPDQEDYEEPIPVNMITEKMFGDEIIKLISRNGGLTDMTSKRFTQIGVAIKIDQKTLGRSKRPKAYAIVILGGKKNQKVKVPVYLKDDELVNG